ncbi:MAG TPA: DegT/DnrJ/EryC1/StrS family aminotransferase [Gaiellaceae bacterium]
MASALRTIPVSAPDLSGREREYVLDCIDSTWVSSKGPYLERFEAAFARFCGSRFALACNNGTSALHLALLGAGVGPGDEVIVPTLTYVASANTVRYCGATVRFVDVLPDTWNLDPADVERKLTSRTKAIMPVHLFGAPADMELLLAQADKHGVALVEDAAEAHGATWQGRPAGSIGRTASFSFYGNKIVTTGEGGMVVTDDEETATSMLMLKGQGQAFDRAYWFPVVGFNYRMTNIQAAIGLAQLEGVEQKLARRAQIAARYRRNLEGLGLTFQAEPAGGEHVHWMVVVLLPAELRDARDATMRQLAEGGVETRPVFYPLHTMPPYAGDEPHADTYPVSVDIAARGICLPTYGGLSDDDVDYVCERLAAALDAVSP